MINSFSALESDSTSIFVILIWVVPSAYAVVKLEAKIAVKNARKIKATNFLNDYIINPFLLYSFIYEIKMEMTKICIGIWNYCFSFQRELWRFIFVWCLTFIWIKIFGRILIINYIRY